MCRKSWQAKKARSEDDEVNAGRGQSFMPKSNRHRLEVGDACGRGRGEERGGYYIATVAVLNMKQS